MANLKFNEKKLIETVFEMEGGYVINFSNRDFKEFMKDVVSYNIYEKYPELSKAKMLRSFINDESDVIVGKFIILLINYMNDNGLIKGDNNDKSDTLYGIGKRLLGKVNKSQKQTDKIQKSSKIEYGKLQSKLLAV